MPDDTIVRIVDVRKAHMCAGGARQWFAEHGLDWNSFLVNGMTAADMRAGGDALCEPVIRAAEQREAAE